MSDTIALRGDESIRKVIEDRIITNKTKRKIYRMILKGRGGRNSTEPLGDNGTGGVLCSKKSPR
jgi:hypothetical protein